MKFKIFPTYLLAFMLSFILFTPIGTLSHEYGHIVVAKYLGYETNLSYGSMTWAIPGHEKMLDVYMMYEREIKAKEDFPGREEYYDFWEKRKADGFWVTVGGPLQTISVGCFGLLILFFRKKRIEKFGLKIWDWFSVFLALFWLREVFNLVTSISKSILNGKTFFNSGGDEIRISRYLDLYPGTISIIMGLLGSVAACYVIFKIVPQKIQLTFILGGLLGGSLGFILWMYYVGPFLFL